MYLSWNLPPSQRSSSCNHFQKQNPECNHHDGVLPGSVLQFPALPALQRAGRQQHLRPGNTTANHNDDDDEVGDEVGGTDVDNEDGNDSTDTPTIFQDTASFTKGFLDRMSGPLVQVAYIQPSKAKHNFQM